MSVDAGTSWWRGLDRTSQGMALALLTALISGFSIFINGYASQEFSSPAVFVTLKNLVVAGVLLGLLLRPGAVGELSRLRPRHGLGLLLLGTIGGSVPFLLFFEGLARVGSGNAAFIHKTLFLWVAALAVVFLRERLGLGQGLALGLLLASQVLLGGPGALGLDLGLLMILLATLLWSVEVVVAKRLLGRMSAGLGATGRMGVGALLMLAYLVFTGQVGALGGLSPVQWAWVLATGLLLLGYVTTWYAALQRAPATAVTCALAAGAPITALLSLAAGRGLPPAEQAGGLLLLVAAVAMVVAGQRRRSPPLPAPVGAAP